MSMCVSLSEGHSKIDKNVAPEKDVHDGINGCQPFVAGSNSFARNKGFSKSNFEGHGPEDPKETQRQQKIPHQHECAVFGQDWKSCTCPEAQRIVVPAPLNLLEIFGEKCHNGCSRFGALPF